MTEFTIDLMRIGLNNKDHFGKAMLVDAYVQIGPIRLRIHLDSHGVASIPPALQDRKLKHEIAVRLRAMALAQIKEDWERMDQTGARRLADEMEP